jgi:hypothetical protein
LLAPRYDNARKRRSWAFHRFHTLEEARWPNAG